MPKINQVSCKFILMAIENLLDYDYFSQKPLKLFALVGSLDLDLNKIIVNDSIIWKLIDDYLAHSKIEVDSYYSSWCTTSIAIAKLSKNIKEQMMFQGFANKLEMLYR
jgi:hypothetical protein